MLQVVERALWQPKFKIFKFADMNSHSSEVVAREYFAGNKDMRPYEIVCFEGNLLLNAGITSMLQLITGTGSPTAFSNANARTGVGDSTTAAAATQTGLQATTNKTYKSMDLSFPSVSSQTMTFQSTYATGDANYAWEEFTIDNGATANVAINRKVNSSGTKSTGTWTLQVAITLS